MPTTVDGTGPSPPGGGPTSRGYVIQARPKPGRKPAKTEPESKRKAQNREAQRNFRQRKLQKEDEFREANNRLETLLKEKHNELVISREETQQLLNKNQQLWHENQLMQEEIRRLRVKCGEDAQMQGRDPTLQHQPTQYPMQTHFDVRHDTPTHVSFDEINVGSPQTTDPACNRCRPDHCACFAEMTNDLNFDDHASVPMEGVDVTGTLRSANGQPEDEGQHGHEEFETDFTASFRKPTSRTQDPPPFTSITEDTKVTDCGFCQGQKEICICVGVHAKVENEPTPLARIPQSSSNKNTQPKKTITGPGSCEDCQSNPRQRAWCQRVAQLRSEATPPISRRNSSRSSSLDVMEPKVSTAFDMQAGSSSSIGSGRTVGCSEAFKLLDGRVSTDPNAMDWRQLKPVPRPFPQQEDRRNTFTMEPGMYSAMELDASSILTTLQHAQRPLRPRASDGTHRALIEEAEERRQASFSPTTEAHDHDMMDAVSQYNIGA